MKAILASALVAALAACGQSTVDIEAEEAALLAAAEEYHETSHNAEWTKLPSFETNDVLILPANAPSISGVEDARRFFAATTALEIEYERPVVEVSRSGDMGYSLANATLRATGPDGSVVEDQVRDFHLWKKQGGEWKIAVDIWNSELPSTEVQEVEQQFVGIWKLASWTKRYEDGSERPDPRSESYLIYTDGGQMCWGAMDPTRPTWTSTPTEADELAAYRGLGMYCATVEVNTDKGFVVHHVDIAKSPNAVGMQRKRFFRFEGPDRLHLRVDPLENTPPIVDSVLIWERVK